MTDLTASDIHAAALSHIKARAALVAEGRKLARASRRSFCDVTGRNLYADKHEEAIDRVLVLVGEGKILGAGVEMGRADRWLALLRSDVVALSL